MNSFFNVLRLVSWEVHDKIWQSIYLSFSKSLLSQKQFVIINLNETWDHQFSLLNAQFIKFGGQWLALLRLLIEICLVYRFPQSIWQIQSWDFILFSRRFSINSVIIFILPFVLKLGDSLLAQVFDNIFKWISTVNVVVS